MTNKPNRPAKRAAPIPLGRAIDRLQPVDRERIRADVAAFLAYVRRRDKIGGADASQIQAKGDS